MFLILTFVYFVLKPRTSKPDIAKDLLIPGFNQHDALELDRTTNNSLFHLLSNPDLRLATSMVKVIIGSSCSQVSVLSLYINFNLISRYQTVALFQLP